MFPNNFSVITDDNRVMSIRTTATQIGTLDDLSRQLSKNANFVVPNLYGTKDSPVHVLINTGGMITLCTPLPLGLPVKGWWVLRNNGTMTLQEVETPGALYQTHYRTLGDLGKFWFFMSFQPNIGSYTIYIFAQIGKELYVPDLWNIDNSGMVCMGGALRETNERVIAKDPLISLLHSAITGYYEGQSTPHYDRSNTVAGCALSVATGTWNMEAKHWIGGFQVASASVTQGFPG